MSTRVMESDDAATAAHRQVAALAAELSARGFVTRIAPEGSRVTVINKEASAHLTEWVTAAPRAGDGSWWFWYSWGEVIAPVTHVSEAAVRLAHVLSIDRTLDVG